MRPVDTGKGRIEFVEAFATGSAVRERPIPVRTRSSAGGGRQTPHGLLESAGHLGGRAARRESESWELLLGMAVSRASEHGC